MSRSTSLWKYASTTVLLQKGAPLANGTGHGVGILMLERSSQSKFMPSMCVFPGGISATVDFAHGWIELFKSQEKAGEDQDDFGIHEVKQNKSDRPPMLQHISSQNTPFSNNIAYRLCAIRETFEESGILLYKPQTGIVKPFNKSYLKEWRDKVNKDSNAFLTMFQELNIVPDIWSLYEWTNWLTPTHIGARRYDTMFYVACVETTMEAEHDAKEIVASKWYCPRELIDNYYTDKVMLAPPQVFEVCRYLGPDMREWESVKQHVVTRAALGCQRWLPVRINCKDGIVSVLPGDDLYPEVPDIEGVHDVPEIDETIEESSRNCKNLHRMQLTAANKCTVLCNITPKFGHKPPLLWTETST